MSTAQKAASPLDKSGPGGNGSELWACDYAHHTTFDAPLSTPTSESLLTRLQAQADRIRAESARMTLAQHRQRLAANVALLRGDPVVKRRVEVGDV